MMASSSGQTGTVYLKDYTTPGFSVDHTDLVIHLGFSHTRVAAKHTVKITNPDDSTLILDSEFTYIESIAINGEPLDQTAYSLASNTLTIHQVPQEFELEIINTLDPSSNSALRGLYQSADMLCTQCEAQGYRRISPALDRPDSLGTYTVKLIGSKADFPVMLCNGNRIEYGDIDESTHYSIWHDPFPKPTYLFAIVAGKLDCLEDHFQTASGNKVNLKFYARPRDIDKCHHAMECLKHSMAWDEQVYGREYDLDIFHVVAVEDFNMGAMENKSLNVFNTKYVLADPAMATDVDFMNVEGVIGHEYFHNWSGNRVTCRDWFQLSLKEGFTVFRDQEFSSDMGSRGVKRIEDVNILRVHQFREDAGPMAHPVRPDSYKEINNFYTATVYNKGAEVVRMLHTLLGPDLFRLGTDLYFQTFDGQAVTTDDFVWSMEQVSNMDLTQFKRWYSQSGTPEVVMQSQFDNDSNLFSLTFSQSCPDTPGQKNKAPFVIPITTALIDSEGMKQTLTQDQDEIVLILDEEVKTFEFPNISSRPVPSVLRRFSAPVKLHSDLSNADLEFQLNHDDDPFNRWEAGQKLFLGHILSALDFSAGNTNNQPDPNNLISAVKNILQSDTHDPALISKLITLPSAPYISEHLDCINPTAVRDALLSLKKSIASGARQLILECYESNQSANTGAVDHAQMGARSLRDSCLDYLCCLDDQKSRNISLAQLENSKCMTDSASAISHIANSGREDKQLLLEDFYQKWNSEPLVVDKWLRVQATADRPDTLKTVERLTRHAAFDFRNPNKVYSLILAFTHANPHCFHSLDGSGYAFLEHWVARLDKINPQVSARLISALNNWTKYLPDLSELMHATLTRIGNIPDLSPDVSEIVEKNLS